LNEQIHRTERYPSQELIEWIREKYEQKQQEKWENSTTTMKERKPHHKMNTNAKTMTKREVVISRLRSRYNRATHSALKDKELSSKCPLCTENYVDFP
jgi:hypothetical protein